MFTIYVIRMKGNYPRWTRMVNSASVPDEAGDSEIVSIGESEPVEFFLHYEGRLPSNSGEEVVRIKHEIRQSLHMQLSELWRSPELRALGEKKLESGITHKEAVAAQFSLGDFRFVPLITQALRLVCHLDVLFLRREDETALITKPKDKYGGDLDNRLKVFFDALRVPTAAHELPKESKPESHEQPYFYCLLQDDSLITKFQVESAKLLIRPALLDTVKIHDIEKHVRLTVRVTTRITALTFENMALLSG